ncbi:MAG TPA: carbamoyl-phosphate synthase (glutamine-hydrolyzing) small subunit [Porphyromonadaceae bacterium]|jgi:carbamoyl-phosphate synthase small subunit|uniref:glutamine-hydrolyzing carbamoyl-phosphate synthase small subunit n=1 Tax=Limibacterium fermenti TaxID=3229863 RepID=UPI000E92F535|nr:carbamoyl-phosphate synthase (glutamine-hydrolyzing) small subunit [Porphyromonadaceae bacterium]HBX19622.1 carbamoyl-phosphate synthase (glutamine-hydrolyzing) small subunit [Porphyromonadaceae bacterium]HBX46958.1 carbamoyl-phosphate synthase (glutamine-hydrolyzing) small subunit [Porphyromonadaceae bacterium]
MYTDKAVRLVLENGMVFQGRSFGAEKMTSGEVVFNTAMVGYPENLTDPSYEGQILTLTYPIIGNYGVPANNQVDGISDFFESERIHVNGLIVQEYSREYSHWNAVKSLDEWLREENVPGIYGIDTRMLTKVLREKGSMLGKIVYDDADDIPYYDPESENLVDKVSCKQIIEYKQGEKKVVLVDCGVKHNIIRQLLSKNLHLIRVPWDYDFSGIDYDGLFITNGPGSPDYCGATVEHLRKAMAGDKPIFGICMGNQLLAKAAGAKVYKLKYGHRGANQPVRKAGTNTCYVTSQNHGYAVDDKTLDGDWLPYFVNMNDATNEGIRHLSKPFFSVQFHPEAAAGPTDTEFFFDDFVKLL